ncbi:unnamed protein product [Paramecium sonneborni]|uniref:Uncharacterized protein n=1 Tax=Paramecium sonneborni TaxID=65129 RepID=A0A8S1L8G7_9CILI|nr:unnamed protein product [Paramecium sonneborni]
MNLRRMRSGGVHADSEQDFLNKIAKQEKQQKRRTYVEETETYEGFIMNSQFTFDCFEGNQMLKTTQQSHFILIMIDDYALSPKRLQNMIENTDYCETMTQSTNDDSFIWSSQPMNYDCLIHNYTVGHVNHLFNIWIINTPTMNTTFKQCYFQFFEAFICVNSEKNETVKEVYKEMRYFNDKVQQFHIKENDEVSPDRKQINNFQQILKTLIDLTTK